MAPTDSSLASALEPPRSPRVALLGSTRWFTVQGAMEYGLVDQGIERSVATQITT
jgi:ATP-dependent protease ClpP protease subunit